MSKMLSGLSVLALLAACAPAPKGTAAPGPTLRPAPTAKSAVAAPKISLDADGLRWVLPNGSTRALPFGTAQADLLASLERVRGPAGQGTNESCGAGPVQYANWPDGLSLVFQDARFAGWGVDGRSAGGITTMDGVGPGMTRAALDEARGATLKVGQSSLGTEFSAGDIHGVLDGPGSAATITDMWSGVSCVAR